MFRRILHGQAAAFNPTRELVRLGISLDAITAGGERLKRGYREAARRLHPDLRPESEKAQATRDLVDLNRAYRAVLQWGFSESGLRPTRQQIIEAVEALGLVRVGVQQWSTSPANLRSIEITGQRIENLHFGKVQWDDLARVVAWVKTAAGEEAAEGVKSYRTSKVKSPAKATKVKKRVDAEQARQLRAARALLAQGESLQAVASTLGLPKSTLIDRLRRTGWTQEPNLIRRVTEEKAQQLRVAKARLDQGESLRAVASKLGLALSTMHERLQRVGWTREQPHPRRAALLKEAHRLLQAGHSKNETARRLGISRSTLYAWLGEEAESFLISRVATRT